MAIRGIMDQTECDIKLVLCLRVGLFDFMHSPMTLIVTWLCGKSGKTRVKRGLHKTVWWKCQNSISNNKFIDCYIQIHFMPEIVSLISDKNAFIYRYDNIVLYFPHFVYLNVIILCFNFE